MTEHQQVSPEQGGSSRLVPLSGSGRRIAGEGQDIREWTVLDREGEELGTVDDLLIDDAEEKVRFLRIRNGGFLGLGADTFVLPVDTVTRAADGVAHVDQDRTSVSGAPAYTPELTEDRYYEDLYGYYGVGPFWSAGYVYPPFPRNV